MKKYSNIISKEAIKSIYDLHRFSTNQVIIDGDIRSRFVTLDEIKSCCMVSRFSFSEMEFLWKEIENKFPFMVPKEYQLRRMNHLNYISKHTEGPCLYIQINNPSNYVGGDLIVDGKKVDLNTSDGLFLNGEEREVTLIEKGVFYMLQIKLEEI